MKQKHAKATLENMRRVFTVPEGEDTTLGRIEKELSQNLMEFLKTRIVAEEKASSALEKDFSDVVIPEDPMFVSEQAQFLLEKVVAQSVHVSSPSFVGHMTSAMPYFMLPLAKIMIGLNQNTVKIETSKAFTPLENQVLGMLHRLIYKESNSFYQKWTHNREHALGVMCSGGTIGNMTALWVARNQLLSARGEYQGVYHDGIGAGMDEHGYKKLAILVSKRGHYSLQKTIDILGIGRKNLLLLNTDKQHKVDIGHLKETILHCQKEKIGIVALVGVAGATETGTVDPLEQMADIAAKNKIFFHVDGAWGGPTLFSEKYKHLLKGIERADSVVMDAHKQLYCPMGSGMALFKNPQALDQIATSAQYIIRKGSRDLGKHTLEGSKPGMAMLVHSGLRIIGRKGYEILINLGIENAKIFAELIRQQDDFELMTEPELNLLTYRYVPVRIKIELTDASPERRVHLNKMLSDMTIQIQKTQRERGKTFVSRTRFAMPKYNHEDVTVFRVVTANPLTTTDHFNDILSEQREIALKINGKF